MDEAFVHGLTYQTDVGVNGSRLSSCAQGEAPRPALIYQHATSEADRAIARALGEAMTTADADGDQLAEDQVPDERDDPDDGAAGVPARVS
jgi:hypothetical protein